MTMTMTVMSGIAVVTQLSEDDEDCIAFMTMMVKGTSTGINL